MSGKPKYFHNVLTITLLIMVLGCASCGYRVRSAVWKLPDGTQSIGIPTFRNLTSEFKIEQTLTRALLREFTARTRGRVDSSDTGVDLVLFGEVRQVNATPVTFDTQDAEAQTFGSAFQITVRAGVKLVRLRDSAVIWQNDDFVFRERYILNSKMRDFFSEDNPALERLARDFAAGLASAILDR